MIANELRIGNWYMSTKWQKPVQCHITDMYELCVMSDGATDDPPVDEVFQPIPLTEEWLMKFGFGEKQLWEGNSMPYHPLKGVLLFFNEGRTEYELSDYLIGYGQMRAGLYYYTTMRWIKYVHQLQNLYFALTGTELIFNQ